MDAEEPLRTQYAAIPWRRLEPDIQVLLITSRGTGRWIVPKGWPMTDRDGADTAATEAYEEAGVRGEVARDPCGRYRYGKKLKSGKVAPCEAQVFGLMVMEVLTDWPEREERRRQWFAPEDAAALVDEPELAEILRAPQLYAGPV